MSGDSDYIEGGGRFEFMEVIKNNEKEEIGNR